MAFGEIIGGQALGLMLSGYNDNRQRRQQEALTDIQMRAQKDMAKYNQELAMKTWEETNYNAQKEQMEKAGLNIGLMYGGGGAGGGTVNSGGGGSAGSGTADGGVARTGMGMQLASQIALLKAQKDNLDANTEKTKAETAESGAKTENLGAGTEKTKVDTERGKVALNIENETQNDEIKRIAFEAQTAVSKAEQEFNKGIISQATQQDEIKRIKNEAIGSGVDIAVKQLGMNLDRRKVNAIEEAVLQGWARLTLEKREITVKELAQASQDSYMRNSNITRGQELDQRQWEAIGNMAMGAVGAIVRTQK